MSAALRATLAVLALATQPAAAGAEAGSRDAYAHPFPGLDDDEGLAFDRGDRSFSRRRAIQETAGRSSLACADCHPRDGRAAPPPNGPLSQPLKLLQRSDLPGTVETVWRPGPKVTPRVNWESLPAGLERPRLAPSGPDPPRRLLLRAAPAVIGLGLLEAVPEADILRHVGQGTDGVSGQASLVRDCEDCPRAPGRFGWRATAATLRGSVSRAFAEDFCLPNRWHPGTPCDEVDPGRRVESPAAPADAAVEAEIDALVFYLRHHEAPPRLPGSALARAGEALFHEVGCAACHRPITGRVAGDHPNRHLAGREVRAYTDLLLHDLGAELADSTGEIPGAAARRRWRTAPLWGLGHLVAVNGHFRLLHDGRAEGVDAAIRWHGGESSPARQRYLSLAESEQRALRAFVESL